MEKGDEGVQKQKIKMEKQLNFQLENLEKRLQRKRINSQQKKILSSSFSTPSSDDKEDPNFLISFQQVKNPKNKVYM